MATTDMCPECGNRLHRTLLFRIIEWFFRYKLKCPVCNTKLWRAATSCQGQSDWYCLNCGVRVMMTNPHFCCYCDQSHLNYDNTFKYGRIL